MQIVSTLLLLLSLSLALVFSQPRPGNSDDLTGLFEQMWNADAPNRAEPNVDWSVDPQGNLRDREARVDLAPGKFFTKMNEKLFSRPTYAKFISLLDNYENNLGKNEQVTDVERKENRAFLEAVYDTPVFTLARNYLVGKSLAPASKENFLKLLDQLWFGLYGRMNAEDSSGFEHVFVGEVKNSEIMGLHSWIQFYLEEKAGRINYRGFYKSSCYRGARVFTIGLAWNNSNYKDFSSIIVGTSPEFEIALYTVAFLHTQHANQASNGKWPTIDVQIGPCFVKIQCFPMRGKYIGTCYIK